MREFKFRAWDRKPKKMYYSETEQFDDMLGFRFKHFEDLDNSPIYMEYTGMKDINGKDIYEGDIVEFKLYADGEKSRNICVVTFENGEFYPHPDVYWPSDEYYGYEYSDFKVLGNIYENSELLKEEYTYEKCVEKTKGITYSNWKSLTDKQIGE